jgi:ELWxxDGT repeat protein
MKILFWHQWLNPIGRTNPARPISRNGIRRRTLLRLEQLEDRTLLSATPYMVLDINPKPLSLSPSGPVAIGSTTYFAAYDDVHGRELWKSDGTAAGTVMVKDINPGSGSSYPRYLTNVNGTLFFVASDGTNPLELWKSDGSAAGTVPLASFSGINGHTISDLTDVNGTLFFAASDPRYGNELWKSDGTTAGTTLVKDINPGGRTSPNGIYYPYSSYPSNLTNANGTLFFLANGGD